MFFKVEFKNEIIETDIEVSDVDCTIRITVNSLCYFTKLFEN